MFFSDIHVCTKTFKTYQQQLELLKSRGMYVQNQEAAIEALKQLNYYRLSGYWYPMRSFDRVTRKAADTFQKGASFDLVIRLYKFDQRLRHILFAHLAAIELAIRTMVGHELGKIAPLIHLDASKLGTLARAEPRDPRYRTYHERWLKKHEHSLKRSKEPFILHHKEKYRGRVPIWAAVEIMDWGTLSHLYSISPRDAQGTIAQRCELSSPQLDSWLKTLNYLRNFTAHHARLFNRNYEHKPKMPKTGSLSQYSAVTNRIFGQLTLVQHLHRALDLSPATDLPQLLADFPDNSLVPVERLGTIKNWQDSPLWSRK